MDSPKSSKPTAITGGTAADAQASSVGKDFVELNSPPLVFTSPRLNPRSQLMSLKRAQFPGQFLSNLSGKDEDKMNSVTTTKLCEKSNISLSTKIVPYVEEDSDKNSPEQFLTDYVNIDQDQPMNGKVGAEEIFVKLDSEVNSNITDEVGVEPPIISRQNEEVHKENTQVDVRGTNIDENMQRDSEYVDQWSHIGHELPVNHALTNRDKENFVTELQNVEAGQVDRLDQSSYLLSGSMEIGKENESFDEANGAALTEPFLEKVQNDPEFQDAQHKALLDQSATIPSHCDGKETLTGETPSMPINGKHDDVIGYPKNCSNSTVKIPKPSGIGLHLNSIVNTVQTGSGATVNVKSAQGNLSIIGNKSTTMINSHLSDDNIHEIHDSAAAAKTSISLSAHIVQPSNNTVVLNSVDDQSSTPGNKRIYTENDDGSDDFNKSSPKKKRMKSSDSGDAGGCKRCNCKRNKCLKLYCDCFAAGIYCADSCACQECFNRPEYVDTVIETRQKIESRNPLAFAPQIVQQVSEQPAFSCGEEGTNFTPSSARHKRGCNCKKSMCLKKYCVCYQANVGCSHGCRCEGCKNVFGQKGEYGMSKDVWNEENTNVTTPDGSFLGKCEMEASGNSAHHEELFNLHNLSPLTPSFEFSNHGKDASKGWFPSRKYYQSPEPGFTFAAPYMMSSESSRNSDNHVLISETGEEILNVVSYEQSHHGNPEMVDEFSAAYHHSSTTGLLSTTPNLQKWESDNSKSQPFSAQRSSLVWRGSPQTPMAQFSGTKILRDIEYDSGLSSIVEDDRPEILKDTSSAINAVKVNSPNKKRVSPPHGRQNEFGASSSAGLRSGRKFILKAVPPFPPLTPCIDSKTVNK